MKTSGQCNLLIDKHYADWYRIYDELFRSSDEKLAYRRLVDFDTPAAGSDTGVVKRFYVPKTCWA